MLARRISRTCARAASGSLLMLFMAGTAEATPLDTASRYLDAYRHFDVAGMASFYEDDAVFTDPTSEIYGKDAYNMEGKDKIVKRLNGFVGMYDSISLDFRVSDTYESAGHVVFLGKAKVILVKDGSKSTMCGKLTTIISVKDEKVIEHRDYFDYDAANKNLKKGDQDCIQ
jgi:ketosteroid isomerase-like protein